MSSDSPCPITVVIANGNTAERELCLRLLDDAQGVKVVALVTRWEELLGQVHRCQPRVLLLQWRLGGWADAAEDWLNVFRSACPAMRILVLALPAEKADAQLSMVHGVRGVLTAGLCPGELLDAVHKITEKDEAWIARNELKDVLERCVDLLLRPR